MLIHICLQIWKVKNSGKVSWPPNTFLVNIGGGFTVGDKNEDRVSVPPIRPGEEVDISVDMVAPR
jgi:hypothetical protein